jgi:hypothetical protein
MKLYNLLWIQLPNVGTLLWSSVLWTVLPICQNTFQATAESSLVHGITAALVGHFNVAWNHKRWLDPTIWQVPWPLLLFVQAHLWVQHNLTHLVLLPFAMQCLYICYPAYKWSFSFPVRIRVKINPPHPLVCRMRRLNGAVLRIRPKKPSSRVTAGVAR